MRFELSSEQRLVAESVRAAIGSWEAPREPELGVWLDDRDDALAERLSEAGWRELWADSELLGAAVAGGIELGRAAAPACLVDEATLGGALSVFGRARHGVRARTLAIPLEGLGLALGEALSKLVPEATLDGTGTVRVEARIVEELSSSAAEARWRAWSAVTLAYFAGLASGALAASVAHVSARTQFGSSLAALPAVQARVSDAALAADGLELLALASPDATDGLARPELLWAGDACCEVTATAQQVHGALGFALETGLHRSFRRAKAIQVWSAAVCAATR